MSGRDENTLGAQIATMDALIGAARGLIDRLEEQLRGGVKTAYHARKLERARLLKLVHAREELSRKQRRCLLRAA
jgi:hypothetical protein